MKDLCVAQTGATPTIVRFPGGATSASQVASNVIAGIHYFKKKQQRV